MTDQRPKGDLIFYQTSEGKLRIEVLYEVKTFWLSQKGDRRTVRRRCMDGK